MDGEHEEEESLHCPEYDEESPFTPLRCYPHQLKPRKRSLSLVESEFFEEPAQKRFKQIIFEDGKPEKNDPPAWKIASDIKCGDVLSAVDQIIHIATSTDHVDVVTQTLSEVLNIKISPYINSPKELITFILELLKSYLRKYLESYTVVLTGLEDEGSFFYGSPTDITKIIFLAYGSHYGILEKTIRCMTSQFLHDADYHHDAPYLCCVDMARVSSCFFFSSCLTALCSIKHNGFSSKRMFSDPFA
eukprot:TRINITY_DN5084_c0_g3_i1.p1 TRINITY_DN5084_c0_g3~~TRINITY_DN5084_c0_g3_i1.p1  ORF type:complete len:246 (+),score=36.71 TRINITY_DN5084_c0_g3_i1:16-753(+)